MHIIIQYTLTFLCSLLIMFIWGVGLLMNGVQNQYTAFIAFIVTAYLTLLMPKDDKIKKGILMIGPLVYLIVMLIVRELNEVPTFPITWAFILFAVVLFLGKKKSIRFNVFIIAFSLGYASFIHDYHKGKVESYADRQKPRIKVNQNLYDFKFLDQNMDTVVFCNNGKRYLIETWNEACAPCLRSIKDMQTVLATDTSFNHIYLYQKKSGKKLPLRKIFNFEKIERKDNIYFDLNDRLYDKFMLDAYPYFLVFEDDGSLIDYSSGYKSAYKEEVLKEIMQMLKRQ